MRYFFSTLKGQLDRFYNVARLSMDAETSNETSKNKKGFSSQVGMSKMDSMQKYLVACQESC
jgi:hypothetical protein